MLRSLLGGLVEVMHATVGLCGVVSYGCPAQVPKTTGGSIDNRARGAWRSERLALPPEPVAQLVEQRTFNP